MLTTKDAERYLDESRISLAVAREQAVEGRPNCYWYAWAHAFEGRCRSLEAVLPRLRKREAEVRRDAKQLSREPDVVARHFPRLDKYSAEAK